MNADLMQRLEGIREILVAQYRGGTHMSSASKGLEREIFVNEFLLKVFPPNTRFGTGDIIDANGSRSGQMDIVVEMSFHPSFPLCAGGAVRLYLAEGVAAVLEVKSNLASKWKEVESVVERVRQLKRSYKPSIPYTIPVFAVGFTGYKTLRNPKKRLNTTEPHCRPTAVLVLEPGMFIYEHPIRHQGMRPHHVEASGAKSLIGFIDAISFETVSWSSEKPNLGAYQKDEPSDS